MKRLSVLYLLLALVLAGSAAARPASGEAAGGYLRQLTAGAATTASTSDPVIAAAGDIACDPADPAFKGGQGTKTKCRMKATSDLLVNASLAAVLTLGDNQYEDGAYGKFLQSYEPTWGRLKAITRPSVGNHEYLTAAAAGYFQYFGAAAGDPAKGYYSFDVGSWHLIALNSNCAQVGGCAAGSPQEQWLRADLAAHQTASCTLAFSHHPRFSSGLHGNSTSLQPLWQALYDANADVVLAGHDHDYERFAPQGASGNLDPVRGLREFVVGTGGKSLRSFETVRANSELRNSKTFGVLKLQLHANGYDWQFAPEAGKTFADTGSGTCH